MKSFLAYMEPTARQPLRLTLSDRFADEEGQPLVWELRELDPREGTAAREKAHTENVRDLMLACAAEALTCPDLHAKECLDALSQKAGRAILNPLDGLRVLLTDGEATRLAAAYSQYLGGKGFSTQVDEIKN